MAFDDIPSRRDRTVLRLPLSAANLDVSPFEQTRFPSDFYHVVLSHRPLTQGAQPTHRACSQVEARWGIVFLFALESHEENACQGGDA